MIAVDALVASAINKITKKIIQLFPLRLKIRFSTLIMFFLAWLQDNTFNRHYYIVGQYVTATQSRI